MKEYSLQDISKIVGGKLKGDSKKTIFGISTLLEAQEGQVSFLDNSAYKKYLATTKASAVILSKDDALHFPVCIIVSDPYLAYAKLSHLFDNTPKPETGIHKTAVIDDSVSISESASVGANTVIKKGVSLGANVVIGAGVVINEKVVIADNCKIADNVTIYHNVKIGQKVIIHSGAVIGSDGFGNARSEIGWLKIMQLGSVNIGDDVEIGASTTIDRGALNDTIIGRGVKIDNQVQVGHNVEIGDFTAIAGCTGIAGSTKIGSGCMIGGKVSITGHIKIADGVIIAGASSVSHSLRKAGIYASGTTTQELSKWRKNCAHLRRIDKYFDKLQEMRKELNSVKKKMDEL